MILESALHSVITPNLIQLGYQYQVDERIRNPFGEITDLRHTYKKELSFGQTTTIAFLRRRTQYYEPLDFAYTVRLHRVVTGASIRLPSKDLSYFQPQDAIHAALSQILWHIYCLRVYPASYHWWWPETEEELLQQLTGIGGYLTLYAVPWIEHPWATAPVEFSNEHDPLFRSQLEAVVAPPLLRLGYHTGCDPVREPRWPYFTKVLPSGLHAVIHFGHALHDYFGRWSFGILLERKPVPGNEPYTADEPGTLFAHLSDVCAKIYGLSESPFEAWEYLDQVMLEQQLQRATTAIIQYGLPWLEDPLAKPPYS